MEATPSALCATVYYYALCCEQRGQKCTYFSSTLGKQSPTRFLYSTSSCLLYGMSLFSLPIFLPTEQLLKPPYSQGHAPRVTERNPETRTKKTSALIVVNDRCCVVEVKLLLLICECPAEISFSLYTQQLIWGNSFGSSELH